MAVSNRQMAKWVEDALNSTYQGGTKVYKDRHGRDFILLRNGATKFINLPRVTRNDKVLGKSITMRHHRRGF